MRNCKYCNGLNNDVDTLCIVCNKNIDGNKSEQPAPKPPDKFDQLKKCLELDSTAKSLFRISEIVFVLGVVLAIIQLFGLSLVALYAQERNGENFSFVNFLPAIVNFLVIIGLAWIFSALLKAIANIVQNTKNSARILEYQTMLQLENKTPGG